ncbi:MAG: M20/M25/M40 family metallo-hydrolase [Phycisphaerales bacterium]|nr:M20/M25/M40 family metallo-hydrolase [Phycisphaerales bacterium]
MSLNVELLRRLCETPGVPGREERVRDLIRKEIKGLFDEVRVDAMGSLICTRKPTQKPTQKSRGRRGAGAAAPRVMLAAHMDEIGFYVRHVDDKGFLWLNPAGGFDPRNLFSRRVLVCTGKGDFVGVMNPGGKPIHISSEEDRKKVPPVEEFFVDLGMELDEVRQSVQIGDYVVMHEPFVEQPTKLVSKALDNRIACYVAIEAVRKLSRSKAGHGCEVVVAFTVQEEVGLRGAITASNAVQADLGIGLDVTLACDTPGVPESQRVTKHGDGVGIMWQDSSMIADYALSEELCGLAKRSKIPFQRCILPRGGQDGAAIQRANAGARVAAIVVGTRYIHTVTESAHRRDLQAAVDLLATWLGTVA